SERGPVPSSPPQPGRTTVAPRKAAATKVLVGMRTMLSRQACARQLHVGFLRSRFQRVDQLAGSTTQVLFQHPGRRLAIAPRECSEDLTMLLLEGLPMLEHEPMQGPVAIHPTEEPGNQLVEPGTALQRVDQVMEVHVERAPDRAFGRPLRGI